MHFFGIRSRKCDFCTCGLENAVFADPTPCNVSMRGYLFLIIFRTPPTQIDHFSDTPRWQKSAWKNKICLFYPFHNPTQTFCVGGGERRKKVVCVVSKTHFSVCGCLENAINFCGVSKTHFLSGGLKNVIFFNVRSLKCHFCILRFSKMPFLYEGPV